LIFVGALLLAATHPAFAFPLADNRTSFASPRFAEVWDVADQAVQEGRTTRSWTWGPRPWFDYREFYQQSPDGLRLVQYFDKARMEINNPETTTGPLGGVTNGLLVVEMVSGRLKLGEGGGDDQNVQHQPASIPVAGDISTYNDHVPYYANFKPFATADNGYRDPNKVGQRVGTTIDRSAPFPGLGQRQDLADVTGTDIVAYEANTGHNIPRVFRDFLNSGPVPGIVAFGLPITDPYWIVATVGGQDKDVMIQFFERRTLTYTPSNPPAFQVEMGNVGQHYFRWRYPRLGLPWESTGIPQVPLITFASNRGGAFQIYQIDESGRSTEVRTQYERDTLPFSLRRSWDEQNMQIWGDTNLGQREFRFLRYYAPDAPPRGGIRSEIGYQPAVSPDGNKVVFVSERDGNPDLYIRNLTELGDLADPPATRLTETAGCANGHPGWLPDGSGIIYESNCQGGNWEIFRGTLSYKLDNGNELFVNRLISPVPGEAIRLTSNSTDDRSPRVSPDGTLIAFTALRDGNAEVYSMSSDGGQQTRLTSDNHIDQGATWSADGSKLAFNSNRDGDFEIFVMNRDGSGQTQLTSNTADDGFTIWAQ
jgi:hypothetical protein